MAALGVSICYDILDVDTCAVSAERKFTICVAFFAMCDNTLDGSQDWRILQGIIKANV